MLYHFLSSLGEEYIFFNLFRYLSFRMVGATLTALASALLLGPWFISLLKRHHAYGQPIRKDMPRIHLLQKKGTPTMGGLLILFSLIFSTLLWARLDNPYIWSVIFMTTTFAAIGLVDDIYKLKQAKPAGLSGRWKIFWEVLAVLAALGIVHASLDFTLAIPFFKSVVWDLGWFFPLLAILVVVGTGNAVNLTDGLDGLAIGPVIIAAASFAVIAYLTGNKIFAGYLQIHHVAHTGELAVLCAALVGSGLGFLWFNAPPASVFMGDTGSLGCGAALGMIAIITKHEIVLAIIGGLFVLETVSVIVQVASFRIFGRRVFRMAPLHHHFEKKGWAESTIVIRFWIIALVLALFGLATLKLR